MSPPTRLNILHSWDNIFLKNFANNGLFQKRKLIGGVVLRAANQNKSIACGNRTLILMTPPYEGGRFCGASKAPPPTI